MDTKHTESFEPKSVSKKNEANSFDDLKKLVYKIIQFNFLQRKKLSHNR
jgi:hypothetical protein